MSHLSKIVSQYEESQPNRARIEPLRDMVRVLTKCHQGHGPQKPVVSADFESKGPIVSADFESLARLTAQFNKDAQFQFGLTQASEAATP